MSSPEASEAEIRYYRNKAAEFTRKAMAADPASFLQPFVVRLKPAARILDVGCGCGRDLRWLRDQGFLPQGLERSPELADLARSHSGCKVHLEDFTSCASELFQVDGLLLSGALVHLPPLQVAQVIARFLPCLSEEGRLYVSLKEGSGVETDGDGRRFYLWEEDAGCALWQSLSLDICYFKRQTSAVGTRWLAWVLRPEKNIPG